LPRAAVEALKQISLTINENQILPLPFYQARIIWNNPEEQLQQLKLSSAWINNLQQQQTYRFQVAAENNASCQLLAHTIQTTPDQFADNLQLQFTVSAAKIDSKVVSVKSEHIVSSQLVASLKNLPSAVGANRYLTSSDYNRMLWQISNQVIASEVTSGDYVDTDDELSLKDVIAQMFETQKENTAKFDDKMWNSVFWDPLDERPDKITNELNKFIFFNQTDHRAYLTQAGSSSSSAKVNAVIKAFSFGGEGSHTSSSSMTTDDITHLLENYDIESQVQGEKFVPKQLDLTRLNVNDLSRKDLLTSKRIRVRQVDISGVLQVGIGNASRDSTDDQNRFLRQQLNDLQSNVGQMQSNVGQVQAKVGAITNDVNGLKSQTATINQVQGTLTNEVGTLKAQAANIHVYSCGTYSSAVVNIVDGGGMWKMQQPNTCPPGKYMTSWRLTGERGSFYHIEFICC
jgi:hypothetical protein